MNKVGFVENGTAHTSNPVCKNTGACQLFFRMSHLVNL
jgi:hypothetical protein